MSAFTESRERDLTTAISAVCASTDVSGAAAGLAQALSRVDGGLTFLAVLSRGGWYRPGGVVDDHGLRVAPDVVSWAEAALGAAGDDLQALWEAHRAAGLHATRFVGSTHYLVATYGAGAADYMQVEVEELHESISHRLFDSSEPTTLEALCDRPAVPGAPAKPLGQPFYALRRVTDVAAFLAAMATEKPDKAPVQRFVDAWQASSAGAVSQFSNHWVLALRTYRGAYGQVLRQASPVAALNGEPHRFSGGFGARGLALNDALQQFDRVAGYPMAWFFHMLTTKQVPHAVAQTVIEDVQTGFGYLPERDVAVLKSWLYRPFSF